MKYTWWLAYTFDYLSTDVQFNGNDNQLLLKEESHTIDLLSIQIDKYEIR